MEFLWSPWRSTYIDSFKSQGANKEETCFICEGIQSAGEDSQRLILQRRDHCVIMMNKYPYTTGHLLIAPLRHIGDYTELSNDELLDILKAVRNSISIIDKVLSPQGYNMGVNIGKAAGAGLPGHIHFHLVPRWSGDKNFMSVIGETNIISFSNEDIYKKLKECYDKIG
jgi:ATP adenylyltransferase